MWKYKNKPVNDINFFPEGCIGFTYLICDKQNKCYVGLKSLGSHTNPKVSENVYKKLKEEGKPVKKTKNKKLSKKGAVVWDYRKVDIKESNWKVYQSSNTELKKKKEVTKEILDFAFSKKQLTYLELKRMFELNVLESDRYYNDNILGKFYRRDVEGIK